MEATSGHQAAAGPEELVVVKDADHVDLYDNMEKIPFDKFAFTVAAASVPKAEAPRAIKWWVDQVVSVRWAIRVQSLLSGRLTGQTCSGRADQCSMR